MNNLCSDFRATSELFISQLKLTVMEVAYQVAFGLSMHLSLQGIVINVNEEFVELPNAWLQNENEQSEKNILAVTFNNNVEIWKANSPILYLQLNNSQINTTFLRLDSDFYVAIETVHGYLIEEWYAIKGEVIKTPFAKWSRETGFEPLSKLSKWERRNDLNGITLDIMTIPFKPMIIWKDNVTSPNGFLAEVLQQSLSNLNATLKWRLEPDQAYGLSLPNGSFNGIVGRVANRETDVGGAALLMRPDRAKVVNYLHPIYQARNTLIIFKSDNDGPPDLNFMAFVKIFRPLAWPCVFSCHAFIILAAVILVDKKMGKIYTLDLAFPDLQVMSQMMTVLSGGEHTSASSVRILLLSAAFFFELVFAFYSSGLT